MSQNLMNTEPGGESTQYESIHTVTVPHKKSGGQMGHPETNVDVNPEAQAQQQAEAGAKTAEKIRYGQTLSEQGMGGQTTGLGSANVEGGYGGAKAKTEEEDAVSQREKSGYGGKSDMDKTVGA